MVIHKHMVFGYGPLYHEIQIEGKKPLPDKSFSRQAKRVYHNPFDCISDSNQAASRPGSVMTIRI